MLFNSGCMPHYSGRTFVQLNAIEREAYLDLIATVGDIANCRHTLVLKKVYQIVRTVVLTVFYKNFPERIDSDAEGTPLLYPAAHQIVNPNTRDLITGWDIAGFAGPWTWQQEQERREFMKTVRWVELAERSK